MSIIQLLGLEHPIIQAPMVGVSTPALAAAVSNAGALGSIGIGASNPDQARAMLAETRALTSRPFNVNLFCHRPAVADPQREAAWLEHLRPLFTEFGAEPPATLREIYKSFLDDPQMVQMLLDERPAVVSFHFGLPAQDWIDALKGAGIRLLASATTLEEARRVEAAGVDAIVAQGIEAGGHRGVFEPENGDAGIGTLALVRLIARQTRLPVIAAGGIMDGQCIRAAQALGAQGAQLGTAFVACPESAANAAYRAALKSDRAYDTRITAAISGRPARGMVNRLWTDLDTPDAPALPDYPNTYDAAKALHAAASARGCNDFAVQWAGQGAPLAREMPAAELVKLLVEEMQG
ncbi:nitronate monooxygenase [Pseudomonas sp. MOB-449]|nr:nitronate monooxygenase [Pseudomonas sp. MOB-449]